MAALLEHCPALGAATDKLGWSPLHYLCHSANVTNEALVAYLQRCTAQSGGDVPVAHPPSGDVGAGIGAEAAGASTSRAVRFVRLEQSNEHLHVQACGRRPGVGAATGRGRGRDPIRSGT